MTLSEPHQIHVKYVFLDVVDFTKNSVEDQTEIVQTLNGKVADAVRESGILANSLIYLPTGDGICVVIKHDPQQPDSYDVHMRLALNILKGVNEHNTSSGADKPGFEVRIGVNENQDNLIKDINGNDNIAGAGINYAQRFMNLAEGRQIFVGPSAYEILRHHKKYTGAGVFHPYTVTIKGERLKVYQYVAGGNPGLDTNARPTLKKEDTATLFESANACGLKRIFYSRGDDNLRKSIEADIRQASERVWLSGVGLDEVINLASLLPLIKDKIEATEGGNEATREFDVKLLLLDALRSPALFRTFLEIRDDEFKAIINTNREPTGHADDPYFQKTLYQTFYTRYTDLSNRREFWPAVRFYGHTPLCWLVIIDQNVYFQPYTFGRGETGNSGNPRIGHHMPVFKFQIQDEASTKTFSILSDHFKKLWSTSDTDLFHLGLRIFNRGRILRHIFKTRGKWFQYVYDVLYKSGADRRDADERPHGDAAAHDVKHKPGDDRRKYPRKPCQSVKPPLMRIEWKQDGAATQRAEGHIINFSRVAMLLELAAAKPGFAVGDTVTLKAQSSDPDPATQHVVEAFLTPCNNTFTVISMGEDRPATPSPRVVLRAQL